MVNILWVPDRKNNDKIEIIASLEAITPSPWLVGPRFCLGVHSTPSDRGKS